MKSVTWKILIVLIAAFPILSACKPSRPKPPPHPLAGTWETTNAATLPSIIPFVDSPAPLTQNNHILLELNPNGEGSVMIRSTGGYVGDRTRAYHVRWSTRDSSLGNELVLDQVGKPHSIRERYIIQLANKTTLVLYDPLDEIQLAFRRTVNP